MKKRGARKLNKNTRKNICYHAGGALDKFAFLEMVPEILLPSEFP